MAAVQQLELIRLGYADHSEQERTHGRDAEAAVEAVLDGFRIERSTVRELQPSPNGECDLGLLLVPLPRLDRLAQELVRVGVADPTRAQSLRNLERGGDRVEVGEDVTGHRVRTRRVRVEVLHVSVVGDEEGLGLRAPPDARKRVRGGGRLTCQRARRRQGTPDCCRLDE
jgi:hypothetical protein